MSKIDAQEFWADQLYKDLMKDKKPDQVNKADNADTGKAGKAEGKLTAGEKIQELIQGRMNDLKGRYKDQKSLLAEAAKQVRDENPSMWKQREIEQMGGATPSMTRRYL